MTRTLRCTVDAMNYSACGHRIGDAFEVGPDGIRIDSANGGFCYFAVASIAPVLAARLESPELDDWLATEPVMMCPDPPEALRMRVVEVGQEGEQS